MMWKIIFPVKKERIGFYPAALFYNLEVVISAAFNWFMSRALSQREPLGSDQVYF
ncbi:hypothetical protein FHS16_004113 [Paenibacillus endophyticus]|uniref:Uncharacterized protein n=1 Tax=Paenibacillus endophyticus TaxID=1294268 RepID=A0A7W5CAA1_9BACL|nr:hypothetical protein [Paenibacillus endophyticus]